MALTKKREERKSLAQPAWITLEGGFAARQCMVRDISRSGARITLDEDTNQLPGTLRLGFVRDGKRGRSCQVVWRRGRSAGIRFI